MYENKEQQQYREWSRSIGILRHPFLENDILWFDKKIDEMTILLPLPMIFWNKSCDCLGKTAINFIDVASF